MEMKESIVRSEVRTIAPNVSDNHLFELAKKCGLINEHTAEDAACAIVGYAQAVLNDISVQEAFFLANGAGFERMRLANNVVAVSEQFCQHLGGSRDWDEENQVHISKWDQEFKEIFAAIEERIHQVSAYDAGFTANCLPCPICKGVEACEHTVLERHAEVIAQLGQYPEGFDPSCGLPAWMVREANSALCDITGNRKWDVMAIATHMRNIFRPLITIPPEKLYAQTRSCYCGEEISLQSVSGGRAPEGLYGRATLKIGNQYVDYVRRPEVLTFEEFVDFGKASGAHLTDGMPWSFSYKGYPVTHENDNLYLISQLGSPCLRFARGDFLVTGIDGMLSVIPAGEVPEEGGWFMPRKMINSLVARSLGDLIRRAKACSICDVDLRENGENVRFEADWIKYMIPVPVSPVMHRRKTAALVAIEGSEDTQQAPTSETKA